MFECLDFEVSSMLDLKDTWQHRLSVSCCAYNFCYSIFCGFSICSFFGLRFENVRPKYRSRLNPAGKSPRPNIVTKFVCPSNLPLYRMKSEMSFGNVLP